MKKLLIILFTLATVSAAGQNNGAVSIPANADTSASGFALKASLRPYLTKAQVVGTYATLVSPILTAPNIGAAAATSVNKLTLTPPATSATLTIANGTTLSTLASFAFDGVGKATLVAGTKAITITGITASSIPIISFISAGGTITTTTHYAGVCSSNTLTITALTSASAVNTSDTSIISYLVIN
jgi:hypothetical protein